jgi:hypothetical protein
MFLVTFDEAMRSEWLPEWLSAGHSNDQFDPQSLDWLARLHLSQNSIYPTTALLPMPDNNQPALLSNSIKQHSNSLPLQSLPRCNILNGMLPI